MKPAETYSSTFTFSPLHLISLQHKVLLLGFCLFVCFLFSNLTSGSYILLYLADTSHYFLCLYITPTLELSSLCCMLFFECIFVCSILCLPYIYVYPTFILSDMYLPLNSFNCHLWNIFESILFAKHCLRHLGYSSE